MRSTNFNSNGTCFYDLIHEQEFHQQLTQTEILETSETTKRIRETRQQEKIQQKIKKLEDKRKTQTKTNNKSG